MPRKYLILILAALCLAGCSTTRQERSKIAAASTIHGTISYRSAGRAARNAAMAASVCAVSSSSTTQLVAPSTRIRRRAASIGTRIAVSS